MNKEVVKELQAIKFLLANLICTSTLPEGERFSTEALDKAADRFQKLSIEKGDWIEQWDIDKIIKNALITLVCLFALNLDLIVFSNEVRSTSSISTIFLC